MKRSLKVVGVTLAVLLMTLFSLAACSVIGISDNGGLQPPVLANTRLARSRINSNNNAWMT